MYSRVHNRWNEVFFLDSEETIHSAEINDTSYEPPAPPILNIFS